LGRADRMRVPWPAAMISAVSGGAIGAQSSGGSAA
jgi:hypothetical protein